MPEETLLIRLYKGTIISGLILLYHNWCDCTWIWQPFLLLLTLRLSSPILNVTAAVINLYFCLFLSDSVVVVTSWFTTGNCTSSTSLFCILFCWFCLGNIVSVHHHYMFTVDLLVQASDHKARWGECCLQSTLKVNQLAIQIKNKIIYYII